MKIWKGAKKQISSIEFWKLLIGNLNNLLPITGTLFDKHNTNVLFIYFINFKWESKNTATIEKLQSLILPTEKLALVENFCNLIFRQPNSSYIK